MTLPTTADFNNAKRDLDDLAEIVTSPTVKDVPKRLGGNTPTLAKVMSETTDFLATQTQRLADRDAEIDQTLVRLRDHAPVRNRGAWITGTTYEVNDIWQAASDVWYVVVEEYVAGATDVADIASGKVFVHQVNIATDTVASIADLRSYEPTVDFQEISVTGYHAGWAATVRGPIGGGIFIYDASDTTSTDNKGTIIVTATGKRWKRKDNSRNDVTYFGAVGDGATDDLPAIQSAIDEGGEVFLPSGAYGIGDVIQIRTNKHMSISGPEASRPLASIVTLPSFAARSMLRNWDESWYAEGETDRNIPPSDITPYISLLSRYVNIRNILFRVNTDAGGRVSPVDLIAQQETSHLRNLVFSGSATTKGTAIRARSSTGVEASFNGWKISDVVVYSAGWEQEFHCIGPGSDVDIDNWVTSPSEHVESPFFVQVIDFTARNLHCEAWSFGKPVFDIQSPDARITQSFVVVQDLSGDIFSAINPYADAGYGYTGLSVTNTRIYPTGGSWSNITNKATMNILNDTVAVKPVVVPIDYVKDGVTYSPSVIHKLDHAEYHFSEGSLGKYFKIEHVPTKASKVFRNVGSVAAGASMTVQWDGLKGGEVFALANWSAGSKLGEAGNDYFNNPQSGRMTFFTSYNGSETRQRAELYNDVTPALFTLDSWDRSTGEVILTSLVDFRDLRIVFVSSPVY